MLSFFFGQITINSDSGNQLLLLVLTTLILLFWFVLWSLYRIEGKVPLFDVGFILISITTLYSIYPLLGFWLSGFEWSDISDGRLRKYKPSSAELSLFVLHNLVYLCGIILSYMTIRKRNPITSAALTTEVDKRYVYAAFILYFLIEVWFLHRMLGIQVPYIFLQIGHNLSWVRFVCAITIIYVAIRKWDKPVWRYGLFVYLLYVFLTLFLSGGGRTVFFLIAMATIMFYHRYVKAISFMVAIVGFMIAITLFNFWGFHKVHLLQYADNYSLWTASNEFFSLLGTAYDIYLRKEVFDTLGEIPMQIYFNDIVLQVPSQFLPFEKISTSDWYLEILGLRGTGVGLMFGVISQGVISGGLTGLFVRGLVVGLFTALMHNWYLRHQNSLWVNVSYVFISVRIYYTYRAGSGYILYDVIYRLIPALLLIYLVSNVIWPKFRREN